MVWSRRRDTREFWLVSTGTFGKYGLAPSSPPLLEDESLPNVGPVVIEFCVKALSPPELLDDEDPPKDGVVVVELPKSKSSGFIPIVLIVGFAVIPVLLTSILF